MITEVIMSKKLTVAVVGCGAFAKCFVPLFMAHPYVEKVFVCDLAREKAEAYAEKFGVEIIDSFEKCLEDPDINCIAIFTQRHTHGPLAVAALEAGKHVYSAVPMAATPSECEMIVKAVERTGLTYMMGETCVYYPCSMYCKDENEKGTFGNFVYAESQYFHDISHFPIDFVNDRPNSAVPPFLYPTHSTAMVLNATGARVLKVTAFGYKDVEENTPYKAGENPWDNEFSNEFSLMQLSNGGVARVSECRRIGYKAPSSYISGFYGTKASYQFSNAQHLLTKITPKGVELEDVSDKVNPVAMTENCHVDGYKNMVANHKWQGVDFSPAQMGEVSRLPKEFLDMPSKNGHMASHQLLIDDFCKAVYEKTLPRVNAWLAARYTVPGLIAHESAKLGGVVLNVPDFGDPPKE